MSVPAPTIGQILGHYRIVEQIGAGGMAAIYRARDVGYSEVIRTSGQRPESHIHDTRHAFPKMKNTGRGER